MKIRILILKLTVTLLQVFHEYIQNHTRYYKDNTYKLHGCKAMKNRQNISTEKFNKKSKRAIKHKIRGYYLPLKAAPFLPWKKYEKYY